uniref:Uncharacterized protein n=1 Tax=Clastoptera arizonana TaxID=38151 RepID=A0A1B6DPM6_9HEMI
MPPKRRSRVNSRMSYVEDIKMGRLQANGTTNFQLSDFTFTDRRRPFRIDRVRYQIVADKKPIAFNMRFYGPQSSADSVVSFGLAFAEGIPVKGTFTNTCKLFYPSGTANATILFAIDCPQQFGTDDSTGSAIVQARFIMGPEEYPDAYSDHVVQPVPRCDPVFRPNSPESSTGSWSLPESLTLAPQEIGVPVPTAEVD